VMYMVLLLDIPKIHSFLIFGMHCTLGSEAGAISHLSTAIALIPKEVRERLLDRSEFTRAQKILTICSKLISVAVILMILFNLPEQ